jgi:adenylate cyclase
LQADDAARLVVRSFPGRSGNHRWPVAAIDRLVLSEEARDALEPAIAIAPGGRDFYVRGRLPWFRPEDGIHLLEGLRKAGWQG